jgi:hypothetical protein
MKHHKEDETMKHHHEGCPRLQFWDAGEYEAPCWCDDPPTVREALQEILFLIENRPAIGNNLITRDERAKLRIALSANAAETELGDALAQEQKENVQLRAEIKALRIELADLKAAR